MHLHGQIVPVIGLDAAGGLHLHQAPARAAPLGTPVWQQQVHEHDGALGREARLEEGAARAQGLGRSAQHSLKAVSLGVKEDALPIRVRQLPGQFPHPVAGIEARLLLRRDHQQVTPVGLQPQTPLALAVGQEAGFGERGQQPPPRRATARLPVREFAWWSAPLR